MSLALTSCDLSAFFGNNNNNSHGGNSNSRPDSSQREHMSMPKDIDFTNFEDKILEEYYDSLEVGGVTFQFGNWVEYLSSYSFYIDYIDEGDEHSHLSVHFFDGSVQTLHKWEFVETTKMRSCSEEGGGEFVCTACEEEKTVRFIPTGRHEFSVGYSYETDPTCEREGVLEYRCDLCGYAQKRTVAPYGHAWNTDRYPEGFVGTASSFCYRCLEKDTFDIQKPIEHRHYKHEKDVEKVLIEDNTDTIAGYSIDKCEDDNCRRIKINRADASGDSYESAVSYVTSGSIKDGTAKYLTKVEPNFEQSIFNDGGKRFFGRPIGNARKLNARGLPLSLEDQPDENIKGSFFEYKIDLKENLTNAKLQFLLEPDADYDVKDIWKTIGDIHGYRKNEEGEMAPIEEFNIIVKIDGEEIPLISSINTPINRMVNKSGESLYYLPMEGISLEKGMHTIRFIQASGVRHTFNEIYLEECLPGEELEPFEYGDAMHIHEFKDKSVIYNSAAKIKACKTHGDVECIEVTAENLFSGQKNPDSEDLDTALGNGGINEDIVNITKIDPGKYYVYLEAKCQEGDEDNGYWYTKLKHTDPITGEEIVYEQYPKYEVKVIEGMFTHTFSVGKEDEKYGMTGINSQSREWTNKEVAVITIPENATRMSLRCVEDTAFALWIYGIRLIKIE